MPWAKQGNNILGESAGDYSGWSISLSNDGNTVAIGAKGNDDSGVSAGHVRIYRWDGYSWVKRGADIDGGKSYWSIGSSVSLSNNGNIVAISAPGARKGPYWTTGHVQVYEWIRNSWVQRGNDIVGEAPGDSSGRSISLSNNGNIIAIGAPENSSSEKVWSSTTGQWEGGNVSGHVRVYEWSGGYWVQRGNDIDGKSAGDWSGFSVSLSNNGNTVAIGFENAAGGEQNNGSFRVYEWDGGYWDQRGDDIVGENAHTSGERSVSLSSDGNTVAIGEPTQGDDESAQYESGFVRVYEWGGSSWVQRGNDIDGKSAGDRSGYSVSLSNNGNTVAIGCPQMSAAGGVGAGHVLVYEWGGGSWVQRGNDIDGITEDDWCGFSVSLSNNGDTVAIGAPGRLRAMGTADVGTTPGYVQVYEWVSQLMFASMKGDKDTVDTLIENGADVNAQKTDGTTALMFASMNGHTAVMDSLIADDANVNAQKTDGTTALMFASMKGDFNTVVKLLWWVLEIADRAGAGSGVWKEEVKAFLNTKKTDGTTALMFAAREGRLDIVRYLIASMVQASPGAGSLDEYDEAGDVLPAIKEYVNTKRTDGTTALIFASANGHLDIVSHLLDNGALVNAQKTDNATALMFASLNGHLDIVGHLLDNGADVNAKKTDNATALMFASMNRHLDMGIPPDRGVALVMYLLGNGADVNAKKTDNATSLMFASLNGHLDIVTHLLATGADVNAKKTDNATALMFASLNGHLDIVTRLLDSGALVDATKTDGTTAFMFASMNGHLDIVRYLFKNVKGQWDATKTDGTTALMFASMNGHKDTVVLLRQWSHRPAGDQREDGSTALMFASMNGHLDIVMHLVLQQAQGRESTGRADVNAKKNDGTTALMFASANGYGYTEIVNFLIKGGALVNAKKTDGVTALMIASKNGHLDIVDTLIENGANVHDVVPAGRQTPLMWAAGGGWTTIVSRLLEARVDVNAQKKDGWTALMAASAKSGSVAIVVNLLKAGANVDAAKNDGYTALMAACKNKHVDIVNILIQNGADVNAQRNTDRQTSLMWAAQFGRADIVDALIKAGANVNLSKLSSTGGGWTALMAASMNGHVETVGLLLVGGATVDAKMLDGTTALMWASSRGHEKVVKSLLCQPSVNANKARNNGDTALILAKKNNHGSVSTLLEQHIDTWLAHGDPYITPVYGPKYKLPDRHGIYRYISSRAPYEKRFTLDVDVLGLSKEQQREGLQTLVAKYKDCLAKYNKKVTLEGFFFRNYLLTNKGEKLLVDTEANTINNCPVENFVAPEDSLFTVKVGEEQTITMDKQGKTGKALYTVSINTYHETYGDITFELYKFENPQWRNGIMMRTSKRITHENSKGLILGFQHAKNFTIKKLGSKKDILDFDTKKVSNAKEIVEEFSYIEEEGAEITTKKVINRFKQQR